MELNPIPTLIKIISSVIIALTPVNNVGNSSKTILNNNMIKDLKIESVLTDFSTEIKYNEEIKNGEKKVIIEGIPGIKYIIGNKEIIVSKVQNEIVEEGIKEEKQEQTNTKQEQKKEEKEETKEEVKPTISNEESYTGKLTRYSGDCQGCSGTVACRTRNGSSFNLLTSGVYYNDSEFGNVRILSAATSKFKCGSIIEINKGGNRVLGVVLDTGGDMRNAWQNGIVWMDIAVSSSVSADGFLGNNVKFTIKRLGW